MPALDINRETYDRLARKAAARNMTIARLVEPMLDQLAADEPTAEERRVALDQWMRMVQSRAHRYPAGFVADDTRESIYEGRGE
jgi:predicted DNA-binding ribbon-helix-helix protein